MNKKYIRREETPEQKKERLARHEEYMNFILRTRFRKGMGSIEGNEFFTCKKCQKNFDTNKEAIDHYFSEHHIKKNAVQNPGTEKKVHTN